MSSLFSPLYSILKTGKELPAISIKQPFANLSSFRVVAKKLLNTNTGLLLWGYGKFQDQVPMWTKKMLIHKIKNKKLPILICFSLNWMLLTRKKFRLYFFNHTNRNVQPKNIKTMVHCFVSPFPLPDLFLS